MTAYEIAACLSITYVLIGFVLQIILALRINAILIKSNAWRINANGSNWLVEGKYLKDYFYPMRLLAWPATLYRIVERSISSKLYEIHRKADEKFLTTRVKEIRGLAKNDLEVIDLLLSDVDFRLRRYAASYQPDLLTPEQIERGLTDNSPVVQRVFLDILEIELTPTQIERALTDKDDRVRRQIAFRNDYTTTAEQIERGISDRYSAVRFWFFWRFCENSMSAEQIERGLTDENEEVRECTARRMSLTPSAMQIDRGLTDSSELVRLAFLERADITCTQGQIARGLKDKSEKVRDRFSALIKS